MRGPRLSTGAIAIAVSTRRVYVRPPRVQDGHEFTSLMRASRAFHRPWASAPTDDERFDAYLADAQRTDFVALLVCRVDDEAILGFFNLSPVLVGNLRSAYLGYAVGKRHARHGYMREGIELVLAHAFDEMRLDLVEANIQPGNRASISLARGAGFLLDDCPPRYLKIGGQWRDHERWVLPAAEWRAQHPERG
jgi:ribosomal-protein-alanine N-acetyltransferase